ncbi:MipA/OmpV family protein [Psychrosphaera sp. I2R16]|uniref:MipA/OmpV family protein n=1 Tax=Psychrosphaera sp. I2R16 TaxID=2841558 RepID=UPI001C082A3B|nr:MipA/OmpV family protein [Psychrosphaera sp. I2R16]
MACFGFIFSTTVLATNTNQPEPKQAPNQPIIPESEPKPVDIAEVELALNGGYAAFDSALTKIDDTGPYSIVTNEFNFQISAGYGVVENPLAARNDLQVYVLPEFSYYGERFYLENFVMGYSLLETDNFIIDVFSYFNDDGYFFELDGLEKLTISSILDFSVNRPLGGRDRFPMEREFDEIDRDLSYMGGFVTSYRFQNWDAKFIVSTDISGVHDGQEASFKVRHMKVWDKVTTAVSASVIYKTHDLIDYYYKLHPGEFFLGENLSLGNAINKSAELYLSYPFNKHFSMKFLLRHSWLDSNLTTSPLVEKDNFTSTFVGFSYRY